MLSSASRDASWRCGGPKSRTLSTVRAGPKVGGFPSRRHRVRSAVGPVRRRRERYAGAQAGGRLVNLLPLSPQGTFQPVRRREGEREGRQVDQKVQCLRARGPSAHSLNLLTTLEPPKFSATISKYLIHTYPYPRHSTRCHHRRCRHVPGRGVVQIAAPGSVSLSIHPTD